MLINLKKNISVGVSIDPERGLEAAQIDFKKKEILKYGRRELGYDKNTNEIADIDIFKEALADLLAELQIPKGTDIILSLPVAYFNINEYPGALDDEQIYNAILEELSESPILKETDPCISFTKTSDSSTQFNRIAYCVASRPMLIETVMQIKSLGYNVIKIEPSINSTLNSLIFCDRVDVASDVQWILMLIESNSFTIISMQGKNYLDCYGEKLAIGDVLGEDENIKTIAETVNPILTKLPAKYLCVLSKTDIISAQSLAKQLVYNTSIVHMEANSYVNEPLLNFAPDISDTEAKSISLDVIGAAIDSSFKQFSAADFNLFNKDLGDVFLAEQPLVFKNFVLSLENMINLSVICAAIILITIFFIAFMLHEQNNNEQTQLSKIESQIQQIQDFLKANEEISTELFDEGDEIKKGLSQNKNIYSYYSIVGTEIPKKLWLTNLHLSDTITIEGQADNIESIYAFYRNIKDYNPSSDIKLQKLGLAANSHLNILAENNKDVTDKNTSDKKIDIETEAILTSLNADFYQFKISNAQEEKTKEDNEENAENTENTENTENADSNKKNKTTKTKKVKPPELQPLD